MAIVIVSCIHCHHALVFLVRIRYVYNSFCFDRIYFDPIRFVKLGFQSIGLDVREKYVHELIHSFIGWFVS